MKAEMDTKLLHCLVASYKEEGKKRGWKVTWRREKIKYHVYKKGRKKIEE